MSLYDSRDKANKHVVKKDETLTSIAAQYNGKEGYPDDLTWEQLALFNWATKVPAEVTRALCERIGTAKASAIQEGAEPQSLDLNPAFGPDTAVPILIPKPWKSSGLELQKTHTVTVRTHTKAAAIGIKSLDKWFIPSTETCDLEYTTVGDGASADQVEFEVYASNYCRMNEWNKGLPTFVKLDDVPVYKSTRDNGETKISDWKGLSNCDKGALSPSGRPLNVAFSPYTAMLRYSKTKPKEEKDKTARIDLLPFWVQFKDDDTPKVDSCKIKWVMKDAERLTVGLLQVVDKKGDVIFSKGLDASELRGGKFDWKGKTSADADVTRAGMPYRVRLEAHRDIDEEESLSLAAMHTEVRLYVHPQTYAVEMKDYVASTDQISLDLSLGDVYHGTAPKRDDGSLWTKYQLALAGFHPGPVNNASTNDHFKSAIREFRRSVPKAGGSKGSYARFKVKDDDDDEVKDALAGLEAERRRPWFGKPADSSSTIDFEWKPGDWPDITASEFSSTLRNPAKRMIIWVDDRNWYTDGKYWHKPYWNNQIVVPADILKIIHDDDASLGGNTKAGRGSWEDRDRPDYDERDIARPWIPLQTTFRLLSKSDGLDSIVAEETVEKKIKAIREAIGPLRVDWTFDEIEKSGALTDVKENNTAVKSLPVLDPEIEGILEQLYHPTAVRGDYDRPHATRTRIALRWALDQKKKTHDRLDVKKTSSYYNAPEDCGGIRPDTLSEYFKKPFALADESLLPWYASTSNIETVYSVVHDQIGQENELILEKRRGFAGVYFHPSRIAGDGYQVRAQVRFEQASGYKFPNLTALNARYEKLPQAHTAEFRLWRKTSIRAYVQWGPSSAWSSTSKYRDNLPHSGPNQWRAYYTACHVHISNELDVANTDLAHDIKKIFPDEKAYKDLICSALENGDIRKTNRDWVTFDENYCWPWSSHPHLGEPNPTAANTDFDTAIGELREAFLNRHVVIALRLSLEIVKEIEKQTGRMRGHVLIQYQTTPEMFTNLYECDTCSDTYTFAQKEATFLTTLKCGDKSCTGTLGEVIQGGNPDRTTVPCGGHKIYGVYTPSCGFPLGVTWNFLGDPYLWAHESGHNRHYEHAADAMYDDKRSPTTKVEHDSEENTVAKTFHGREKADNKRWDRACLMSYVTDVESQGSQTISSVSTYDLKRDMPCFCFKCVLKNRGWRITGVPVPKGDLHDPKPK